MAEQTGRDSILVDLKHFYHHLLLRVGRNGVFALLLIVVLSGSAFAGWKTGFFAELYFQYNRAEIMVILEDSQTGRPLVGVLVEARLDSARQADGQVLETDEQGKVFFDRLQMGETTFRISLPGFKDFFQTMGLNRGPNKELVFSLQIATAEISGAAVDYVDGTPIAGAKVIAAGAEATTDKEGKFVLEEVIIGTPEVTISKDGYYDFNQTVELVKNVAKDMGMLKLLGKGRVVFVSDRDGKNAIYWARFDGSNLKKIWENKAGFDDTSPYLSPDKKKIIFLSNRDNQKEEYGNLKNFLYYNDTSGKSLQKISFDAIREFYDARYGWLADGSGFVYETYSWSEEEGGGGEIKIVEVPALSASILVKSSDLFSGDGEFGDVALSPSSDWIAFMVAPYEETDKWGIYLIHPDGTGQKKIVSITPWEYVDYLKFSADGKRVIYKDPASGDFYSYDIAAGTKTKISTPTPRRSYCSYVFCQIIEIYSSAQNLRAFVDYRDGKYDVYISKRDGTAERRVTFAGGVASVYFAGPDDRYLVYWISREQESAIYVIGLKEGSKPLKVSDISSGFAGVVPE